MPAYSYQAVDVTGKKHKGRIDSSDRQSAVQELKDKGIYVTRLEDEKASIWKREIELGPKRLPLKDFVPFVRQFATLIKAGVNIVETLRILSEQTSNKKLKKILFDAAQKVTRGNQISEAFRDHAEAAAPTAVFQPCRTTRIPRSYAARQIRCASDSPPGRSSCPAAGCRRRLPDTRLEGRPPTGMWRVLGSSFSLPIISKPEPPER